MTPLVSVILPNYNHAKYLKQRINSILEQSYTNIELIILDDCSSDDSLKLIEEYENNPKISQIIINKVNSGSTFKQWQKGFSLTKGKYIWIAESDDYSDLSFLYHMVHFLEGNPKAVIGYCMSNIVDSKGNNIDDWDKRVESKSIDIADGEELVKSLVLFSNVIYNAGMAVFKKAVIQNLPVELFEMKFCGDWFLWIQIMLQGQVIRYNHKLNNFRQHNQKVSPKAIQEGVQFYEGMVILSHTINKLQLSSTIKKIVIGHLLNDIKHWVGSNKRKNQIKTDILKYFGATRTCYTYYKLDRALNLSSLNIKKNKKIAWLS